MDENADRPLLNLNRRVRNAAERNLARQMRLDNILADLNESLSSSSGESGNEDQAGNPMDVGDGIQLNVHDNRVNDVNDGNQLVGHEVRIDDRNVNRNAERNADDGLPTDPSDSDGSSVSDEASGGEDVNRDGNELFFRDDFEREMYAVEMLREWGSAPGLLSKDKIDDLLWRLKPLFPRLPLSHKTLLRTKNAQEINETEDTLFWYKGIQKNLDQMNLAAYLEKNDCICVDINMDGLPLFHKSNKKVWPVLGRLNGSKNIPFIIAIHYGVKDLDDTDAFLGDFVNEVANLKNNGYLFNGRRYQFVIRHYILDAPARSLVKCSIGHSGYASCEKCVVWGEWVDDRVTLLNLDEQLRTDESFRNRDQPHHHSGVSPLERVGTGMVSQFRLDPMHLIYEGAFKRLLEVWRTWRGAWRLHRDQVSRISQHLVLISPTCPSDFNRRPRTLKELPYYKATEYRRLLLYDGILVFMDLINENFYKHFLLLHSAVYILSSPKLLETMCDYANQLLRTFIEHGDNMFGQKFVVYNIHSLCHLAKECADHGTLESFSAFCFENKLKSMKYSLRSGFKPFQQLINRDSEESANVTVVLPDNGISLSKEVFDPMEVQHGQHFQKAVVNGTTFRVGRKDSCFKTTGGDIVVLKNIVQDHGNIYFSGLRFTRAEDFYQYPLQSSILGIVSVSHLDDQRRVYSVNEVDAKCWLLPNDGSYLCIPLAHTVPLFH